MDQSTSLENLQESRIKILQKNQPQSAEKTVRFSKKTPNLYEEVMETIIKATEFLKNNKNIKCYFFLNRVYNNFNRIEIDFVSRFQLLRRYLHCLKKLIQKSLKKNPEKHLTRIQNILLKAFIIINDWNRYNYIYFKIFRDQFKKIGNQELLREICYDADIITEIEKNLLLNIEFEDNSKLLESKETELTLKLKKIEESQGDETKNINEKMTKINFRFYFEEFIKYFIEISFYFNVTLKMQKKIPSSLNLLSKLSQFIIKLNGITKNIFISQLIKTKLLFANLLSENSFLTDSLNIHNEIQDLSRILFIRLFEAEYFHQKKGSINLYEIKLKKNISYICLNLLFMSVHYEYLEQLGRSYECLNFAYWLSSKILEDDDEVFKLICKLIESFQQKFEIHLRDTGEINIVIEMFQSKLAHNSIVTKDDNFDESNNIITEVNNKLYEKFKNKTNYSDIIIIKQSLDQTSPLLISNLKEINNNEKSLSQLPIEKTPPPQSDNLFEIPIDPSFLHQSENSKRLSILGKKYRSKTSTAEPKNFDISKILINSSLKQDLSEIKSSFHSNIKQKKKKKHSNQVIESPIKSKILTTNKYFLNEEEIKKIINDRHNVQHKSSEVDLNKEMHNLDDFFEKKIHILLSKKCENRSMDDIHKTYMEYRKDEDFDKKEFQFSKKMLRHKKSYSIGKIQSLYLIDADERERLNIVHPRHEVRQDIKEMVTKYDLQNKNKFFKDAIDNKDNHIKLPNENRILSKNNLNDIISSHRKTLDVKHIFDKLKKKHPDSPDSLLKSSIFTNTKVEQAKYYEKTKEVIQKIAEVVYRDLENCEKKLNENSKIFARKGRISHSEEKLNKLIRFNSDLSKSIKNISFKRNNYNNYKENMANSLVNSMFPKKLVKRKSSLVFSIRAGV